MSERFLLSRPRGTSRCYFVCYSSCQLPLLFQQLVLSELKHASCAFLLNESCGSSNSCSMYAEALSQITFTYYTGSTTCVGTIDHTDVVVEGQCTATAGGLLNVRLMLCFASHASPPLSFLSSLLHRPPLPSFLPSHPCFPSTDRRVILVAGNDCGRASPNVLLDGGVVGHLLRAAFITAVFRL